MAKILNNLNYRKIFENKIYDYIFIDVNSLTIVPYILNEKYLSNDNIIITPFIETLNFYINFKSIFPKTIFIFVTDGGISPIITKMYSKYKKNRKCRKVTTNTQNPIIVKNVYDYNVGLLKKLMEYFGEIFISDIHRNEADFIIGYLLNKISVNNKCLVISRDKDLILSYKKNNNVDTIYKNINSREINLIYIESFDEILDIIDFKYIKNINELLYYRSLIGDSSDNIDKPFGITSKAIVNNMFSDAYIKNNQVTYNYIINFFKNKFKNESILNKFITDFRRNLFIMNIFNDQIISDTEKIKLNSYINNIQYLINKEIEINLIHELFEYFGLHYERETVDKMIKNIKR